MQKFLYIVCIIFLIICGLLSFEIFSLNNSLHATKTQINVLEKELIQKTVDISKLSEQISILDESISPNNKRWAKIKTVRKIVTDTIKSEGYKTVPDVNGLTAYASAVVEYSEQYDVPVPLILAVTQRESAFNPKAVSPANARGLMQLMEDTAKECAGDIGIKYYNVFKIKDNVQLGTWYLWKVLNIFNGDVDLAVRAYNAGPVYVSRVIKGEISNYPKETIIYHDIVMNLKKKYEDLYGL